MITCPFCGEQLADDFKMCPKCGMSPWAYRNYLFNQKHMRKKSTAFKLCTFLGIFGAHKFYEGRYFLGILYLLTLGFCGIAWLYDIFYFLIEVKDEYYIPNFAFRKIKGMPADKIGMNELTKRP